MEDSSSYAEQLQDHSCAPLLCPDVLNAKNYTFCHWAKTVTGFDVNAGHYVVVAVTCKRWGCPYCAVRKVRRLAWMSKNAVPTRLLTLTIRGPEEQDPDDSANAHPGRYKDGKTAWDGISHAWPELVRYVRKLYGECEYLRVLEVQKNGMPHFHCMLRCGYLPHHLIYAEWNRLIGAPDGWVDDSPKKRNWAGVNLKKIDSTFRTFRYLVKYLTKLHKIEWTDRHVSYSRNFFRGEDKEQIEYAKLDEIAKYDEHPWVHLNERYRWNHVRVIGEGKWLLPNGLSDEHTVIDPKGLGLPGAPDPEAPPPMKQRLVPGLEDKDAEDESTGLRPDGKRKKTRRKSPVVPDRQDLQKPVDKPMPF
jgi:hypothetical protein